MDIKHKKQNLWSAYAKKWLQRNMVLTHLNKMDWDIKLSEIIMTDGGILLCNVPGMPMWLSLSIALDDCYTYFPEMICHWFQVMMKHLILQCHNVSLQVVGDRNTQWFADPETFLLSPCTRPTTFIKCLLILFLVSTHSLKRVQKQLLHKSTQCQVCILIQANIIKMFRNDKFGRSVWLQTQYTTSH